MRGCQRHRAARSRLAWAAGLLLWAGVATAAEPPGAAVRGLIVKLREASSERATALQAHGAPERLQRVLAAGGLPAARTRAVGSRSQHLDFGRALPAAEAAVLIEQLRARPEVEWVVPNDRERRQQAAPDPLFPATFASSGQWWLFPSGGSNANSIDERQRGAPGLQTAWQTSTGNAAAVVAVLDTGITDHPDLDANVLPGYDFVSTVEYANDGDGWDADAHDPGDWVSTTDRLGQPLVFGGCEADDSSWHGTVIAGMLGAVTNNGVGVAGIAPSGRVLPVRVAGKCGAELADILVGMRWAAGLQVYDAANRPVPLNPTPARVLNISFGGSAACNAAYQDTIDEIGALGVVVVAAAGNESGAVTRPASCRGVIGVAALNRDGFKASYSNFGSKVVIATVGGDPRVFGAWGLDLGDDGMLTIVNDGTQGPGAPNYARVAGTSFATPIVAGVAGLMLSVNPALTGQQLIDGLRASARPHVVSSSIAACSDQNPGRCICSTLTCGAGILDAPQALQYALNPAGYVAPAWPVERIDNDDVTRAVALGADLPPNAGSGPAPAPDSGGGALGWVWLIALAVAVAALARRRGELEV